MVVTVFSKHASLEVQRFRFNLTGMCRSVCACVGVCARCTCVCIMTIPLCCGFLVLSACQLLSPAEGLHTHTHTLSYTHATPTHSHVTPSLFQHYQSAVRFCVFLQDRLRVMCVRASRIECVCGDRV